MRKTIFEERGGTYTITYTMQGDHCLPYLLALPPEEKASCRYMGTEI